jgi:hypothetical protein
VHAEVLLQTKIRLDVVPEPINTSIVIGLYDLKMGIYKMLSYLIDRLCGVVVSVLGYRSGGPGSVPGTTSKKK